MSTWQILIFIAITACVMGCLWKILRAIESLTNCIDSVGVELRKINVKLERVEIVPGDDTQRPMDQQDFDAEAIDAIEAAISNFENLKRIDSANPLESSK